MCGETRIPIGGRPAIRSEVCKGCRCVVFLGRRRFVFQEKDRGDAWDDDASSTGASSTISKVPERGLVDLGILRTPENL